MAGNEDPIKLLLTHDGDPAEQRARLECLIRLQHRMLAPIVWGSDAPGILKLAGEGSGASSAILWRRNLKAPGMKFGAQGAWNDDVTVGTTMDLTGIDVLHKLDRNEDPVVESIPAEEFPGAMRSATRSNAFFPLVNRGRLLGILGVEMRDVAAPGHRPVWSFLWAVAADLAVALERSVYYRLLRDSHEHLRQRQKMEMLGQLSGGVAHDFNNLLTIMGGYSEVLLSRLPEQSEDYKAAEEILEAVQRAESLTKRLLNFSRPRGFQTTPVEINALLRGVRSMLSRLLGEAVDLTIREADDALWVRGDRHLLEEAIVNLAINARDAMPDGGNLELTAFVKRLVSRAEGLPKEMPPGEYICVEVVDTGMGMTDEVRERIFEPFFSTKSFGKGSGLGLTTAYVAVRQHDGWINVESEPGKGSAFRLCFPVLPEACEISEIVAEPRKGDSSGTEGRNLGETILLVEDDEVVRDMTQFVLKSRGFRVVPAANGPHALDLWDSQKDLIDLLVTDLVMPKKMSGLDLAKRLRGERPDLKVIYVSGYSPEIDQLECREGETAFLAKPYDVKKLAGTVSSMLGSAE